MYISSERRFYNDWEKSSLVDVLRIHKVQGKKEGREITIFKSPVHAN